MTETQQKFLRAISDRVPADQVVEVHLFPPIRQGGVETGVAVVAQDSRVSAPGIVDALGAESADSVEPVAGLPNDPSPEAPVPADASTDEPAADDEPAASRLTIHTARYRLTLKGVDRGKWEVDVVAEADAPLDAVDAVVRGVQRRSGEGAEPDRLTAESFREALDLPLAQLERA
jgi:hypothetical protein